MPDIAVSTTVDVGNSTQGTNYVWGKYNNYLVERYE